MRKQWKLVLNTEEVNESENLNYDELEELLEQQFTMEFSNLEKLELECKEISSPDKLGVNLRTKLV